MENGRKDPADLYGGMNPAEFIENPESGTGDIEVEERLAEWLETNRVENSLPCATLYKFSGATGEQKEQMDYFRGVIPSRHEIGLLYGAGRYMLCIRNTTGQKGAKSSSIRFTLHESYNERAANFKREKADKERLALGQSTNQISALPPAQTGKESLLEAVTLVRAMQSDTLAMFKPILERLLVPAVPAAPQKQTTPFEEYALTRQILKDNLKENISMYSTMQKTLIENQAGNSRDRDDDQDDDQETAPDEKQSMFDKIIALAEPFINILAQNNMAAKMAAAGIKAAPQFKEVIKDVGLAKRIISYVEEKEGAERAAIALKNLGINRDDYRGSAAAQTPAAPRLPVAAPRKALPAKKATPGAGRGNAGAVKLNPKMEVKKV